MNKILYALLTLIAFTSCANSFNIQGTSNVSSLDGRKLYLKTDQADSLIDLDSCDVVHGQFAFHGTVDSTKIGQIFMDDINLQFPVVIEKGDITVKLDNTQQRVSGTPLNDKLNDFWTKFIQLRNQYAEIDHEESAAIMNGQDEETVNVRLTKKAEYDELTGLPNRYHLSDFSDAAFERAYNGRTPFALEMVDASAMRQHLMRIHNG